MNYKPVGTHEEILEKPVNSPSGVVVLVTLAATTPTWHHFSGEGGATKIRPTLTKSFAADVATVSHVA